MAARLGSGGWTLLGFLKQAPLEEQGILHVLVQEVPAMAAGTQGIFVRIIFRVKNLIEQGCAFFKAVAVLVSAVKIDLQAPELPGLPGKRERTVFFPVILIEGRAEGVAKNPRVKPPVTLGGNGVGEFGQKHSAVRAD